MSSHPSNPRAARETSGGSREVPVPWSPAPGPRERGGGGCGACGDALGLPAPSGLPSLPSFGEPAAPEASGRSLLLPPGCNWRHEWAPGGRPVSLARSQTHSSGCHSLHGTSTEHPENAVSAPLRPRGPALLWVCKVWRSLPRAPRPVPPASPAMFGARRGACPEARGLMSHGHAQRWHGLCTGRGVASALKKRGHLDDLGTSSLTCFTRRPGR